MCAPDKLKKFEIDPNDSIEDGYCQDRLSQSSNDVMECARRDLQRGTYLGAASMGLLVLAGTLTMPHVQSRRDALGCDSICLGSLNSAKSALSLIGATVMGRLSDAGSTMVHRTNNETRQQHHTKAGAAWNIFGGARHWSLAVGVFASTGAVLCAYQATSMQQLWMSEVVPGMLQQNQHILKALFTEYHEAVPGGSSAVERAASAGLLGMAFGVALMVGPLVGADLLTSYDHAVSAALFLLLMAATLIAFMPSVQNQAQKENDKQHSREVSKSFSQKTLTRLFSSLDVPSARSPAALFLLTLRMLSTLSFHVYLTIWTISLRDRFHFGPKEYGRFFSMVGFFFSFSQGFVAKFLLKQCAGDTVQGRVRLLATCSFLIWVGRYMAFQTHSLSVVYLLYAVVITSVGVVSTILTADTTNIAHPSELGSFFGVLASIENGSGMVGPLLAGLLTRLGTALALDDNTAPLTAVVILNGLVFSLVAFGGYERFVLRQITPVTDSLEIPVPRAKAD